ncbi:Aste57867_627 [Aphanomyces stellatus]|uniref:Aste57867_627 protein n=1 Tax=Aphanomyces stellatus TaxID=120398 RepID=A0A485K328_9STRA|nr:hypothetical protein As57867_000626 [Aphanomyces stellatus]VFT77852.1 Aste57867_627 [Aphanomyces stellatus]
MGPHSVLVSRELLPLILQFQRGVFHEVRPLVPHIYANNFDFFPFTQVKYVGCHSVQAEGKLEADLSLFDGVFAPFVTQCGLRGVDRLLECFPSMLSICLADAARFGRLDLLQRLPPGVHLFQRRPTLMELAASNGHGTIVTFLLSQGYPICNVDVPAAAGHLAILETLHATAHAFGTTRAMDQAAAHGHLHVVAFLHAHREEGCTAAAMDVAAAQGHLPIVSFLHSRRQEGCTVAAVDGAATAGHIRVVEFLLANRHEGGSADLMDRVAVAGHVAIMAMLAQHGMTWSTQAMDAAARHGFLHVIQFLHDQQNGGGCTTHAMDAAAEYGFLEVVQFLHTHRHEGCTTYAMDRAAKNGFLEVVQFLHEHRTEGCTTNAIDWAARNGQADVVAFLCAHREEGFTDRANVDARTMGHAEIGRLLETHWSKLQPSSLLVESKLGGSV